MTFLNGLPLGQFYRLEKKLSVVDTWTPRCYLSDLVSTVLMSVQVVVICVFLVVKTKHFPQGFVATPLEDRSSHQLGLDPNLEAVNLAA
ncbi:hypothetical protein V866_007932 [Kwoniella sp. B9012]